MIAATSAAASPRAAFLLGVAAARARLARRPAALAALLGLALVITGAVIERRADAVGAVDRALAGTFRLVIPLVTFALSAQAAARGHLRESLWPIARYGAPRPAVALGLAAATTLAAAALSAVFGAAAVIIAHAPGATTPLALDALQTAWIGALAAAAYVAWFLLGATFWKRGRGRFIPLALDFAVGGSTGLFGALLPRGHTQNLLGGLAPLHLSQPASSALLAASAAALTLLVILRCRES